MVVPQKLPPEAWELLRLSCRIYIWTRDLKDLRTCVEPADLTLRLVEFICLKELSVDSCLKLDDLKILIQLPLPGGRALRPREWARGCAVGLVPGKHPREPAVVGAGGDR